MHHSSTEDPTGESRKEDHIELAFRSQVEAMEIDRRFDYEPLLAAHPLPGSLPAVSFAGKEMKAPLWVSSMTGGTEKAYTINQNLAQACAEFGLGMGLGSCRPLLYGQERLKDCELWVTLEPCAMCAGAISNARVAKLYYAASDPKGGAVEHGARVFEQEQCLHRPEVYSGMGEELAADLLREFFQARR